VTGGQSLRLNPAPRWSDKETMTMARRSIFALLAAGAIVAGPPAWAAETDDAPVTTARAADGNPAAPAAAAEPASVADQIDTYMRSSPALALPREAAPGVTSSAEPRKVHGEASIAVGTGGYRSVYVRSDLPVGKTGTLSIAVQDSRSNGRHGGFYDGYGGRFGGYGYNGQSLGIGLALGDNNRGPDRCQVDMDNGQPPIEGQDPRACRYAPAGPLRAR
jgi:hypothetical protein